MVGSVLANRHRDSAPSIIGVALGTGLSALGYAGLLLAGRSADPSLLAETARAWFQLIESEARAAGLSFLFGGTPEASGHVHLLAFSVFATGFTLWTTRRFHRIWAERLSAPLRARFGARLAGAIIETGRIQCVLGLLAIVALLAFPTVHGGLFALILAPFTTGAGNYLVLHGMALDALHDS